MSTSITTACIPQWLRQLQHAPGAMHICPYMHVICWEPPHCFLHC
jgi:hypothetical protein